MDTAALHTVRVVIETVHEVHGADKKRIPMELSQCCKIMLDKRLCDNLPEYRVGADFVVLK